MTADESFKRPGAIPFKWEIRPGVPKIQHQLSPSHHSPDHLSSLWSSSSSSSLLSPDILKPPPPCGSDFTRPSEIRTHSFRSSPRTISRRRLMERPVCVSTSGCFSSSRYVLKHASSESKVSKSERISRNKCEVDSRSCSSRWSVSPLGEESPSSRWSSDSSSPPQRFSFASYRSPGMGSDGLSSMYDRDFEWAGFGLF